MALNTERLVIGNNQPTIEEAKEKIDAIAWDDEKGIENFLVGRLVSEIGKAMRRYDLITSLYSINPGYRMSIFLLENSSLQTTKSKR